MTISPKYAVDLNDFEEAVEMRFSNLDLIQVGNYTSNRIIRMNTLSVLQMMI